VCACDVTPRVDNNSKELSFSHYARTEVFLRSLQGRSNFYLALGCYCSLSDNGTIYQRSCGQFCQLLWERRCSESRIEPSEHGTSTLIHPEISNCFKPLYSRWFLPPCQHPESPAKTEKDSEDFELFSESFDTLSEVGRHLSAVADDDDTFSLSGPVLSPSFPPRGGAGRSLPHRRRVDIALPKLKAADEDDDFSLGDISPIKVVFGNNKRSSTIHCSRRLDMDLTPPPHFISGPPMLPWNPHPPPSVSNPFYVIRSSSHHLAGCKYTLPCLQGVDMCRVHVSEYGHVHHYRDPNAQVSSIRSSNGVLIFDYIISWCLSYFTECGRFAE
jgi:hypothetical protein